MRTLVMKTENKASIYFDNAASTFLSEKVKLTLLNTLDGFYGNPSSIHSIGEKSKKLLEDARRTFASYFNVEPNKVIFTSGATESNNLAIKGYLETTTKKEIITSRLEHSSIIEVVKKLEKNGYIIHYVDTDDVGRVNPDSLEKLINDNTALVTLGVVNNEIGTIQDYRLIHSICAKHNVCFHSDAAQALGHVDIDWSYFDLITISAHKIHGPKGVGALIITNPNIELSSQIVGGGQENGYRSGTENVVGINAFAVALNEIKKQDTSSIKKLKLYLLDELKRNGIEYLLNGDIEHSSPFILNISLLKYDADTVVKSLSINNVFVSSASACNNNVDEYSHILMALYNSIDRVKSSLRVSFSLYNNLEECSRFAAILGEILRRIAKN